MKHRDFHRLPLRDHGALSAATLNALGLHAQDVLDLSMGGNAYGPSPRVAAAIAGAALTTYPDPTASAARAAIAQRFGTSAERVVLGNGASELIWSCARALLRADDTVIVAEPTYLELAAASRQIGARVVQWRAVERTGYRIDLEQISELMRLEQPALVWLCAPNLPTGASLPFAEIQTLATRFTDTWFVVDQSWLALCEDHADLQLLPRDNVVCIRSLGKELGVPGLRVGYLLAEAKLAARIEAGRPAFSTSSPAQAAAISSSTDDDATLSSQRRRLLEDRDRLAFVVQRLGLHAAPSVAPFLLLRMARAAEVAHELLVEQRVAVHECTAFGLPDHLRIAGVAEQHERRFTQALSQVIERRRLLHGREP